jgi:protein-L-isoaspartate(D-aspartate) O-methyltransferase
MLMFGRIGFGATISAPHMHAHAAENLLSSLPAADFAGGAILDVGSGSGYRKLGKVSTEVLLMAVTAVFHHLAPHATVVGIDHIQGLVDMSRENLRKDGIKLGTGPGEVEIICGDGRLGRSLLPSERNDRLTTGSPRHGWSGPEYSPALSAS